MNKRLYELEPSKSKVGPTTSDPVAIVCAALVLAMLVLARQIAGVW